MPLSGTVERKGTLPWCDRSTWLYPAADIGTIDWWFRYNGELDVDTALRTAGPYLRGRRTAVQAGGCIGVWPIRLAQVFETVHTFEAEPVNYKCLAHNTQGIGNLVLHHAAIGNADGCVSMHLDEKYDGHCGAFYAKPGGDIPMCRVDDLHLEDLDFMWLDIEGGEYDAILGAAETIHRCRPVIGFEMREFSDRYNDGAKPTRLLQNEFGYTLFGNVFGHDWLMIP